MDILTNNIDRGEFKIRVHEGIIFRKGNLKIHDELKRLDSRVPGILPFYYLDKEKQYAKDSKKQGFNNMENNPIVNVVTTI